MTAERPERDEHDERRALAVRLAVRLTFAVGTLTVAAYLVLLGPRALVDAFAGREKVAEHVGAAAFLGASIAFVLAARRLAARAVPGSAWRRAAYWALGLFFFVACGEELSWGQHALGFSTPEAVRELNAQQELNLHNLWWLDSYGTDGDKKSGWRAVLLNSNRLFDLFMLGFFVVLPILRRGPLRLGWLERLDPPTPAPLFASVLALTVGLTVLWELLVVDDMLLHLSVSEVREMSYGLLAFAAAVWLRAVEAAR